MAARISGGSVNKDWLRALKLTARIGETPNYVLADAFDDVAEARPEAPALLSDGEKFTFRQLVEQSLRYAHWGLAQGLRKGDVVALVMEGRPDYIAIWLGLSRIGVVSALINSNLTGASLAHCIRIASPLFVLCGPAFRQSCVDILPDLRRMSPDCS